MKDWRYPFDKAPEAVFVMLGSWPGDRGPADIAAWLESVLPLLNWRSHLFLVSDVRGRADEVVSRCLDVSADFLDRHAFANLIVHPAITLGVGDDPNAAGWDLLVAPTKRFQQEAHDLLSEARLHLAPIVEPSPEVTSAAAMRAADFFRSRLAVPSFYLRGGVLNELPVAPTDQDVRYFLDPEGFGLPVLLWRSHVLETVLERIDQGEGSIAYACRDHLVVDFEDQTLYSCFHSWMHGGASSAIAPLGDEPPLLPTPPKGSDCARCIADAALHMRENLHVNKRQAEGRKAFFRLSLEMAGCGECDLGAELAQAAFDSSEADSDRTAALIQQALCHQEAGQLQKADDALALAGNFTNDKGQIAYHRGRVQFVWRDYIEALEWFEAALDSGSEQVPVEDMCFDMALSHINIEEYAEARPYLERSEKPGQRKAPVAFYRGVCDHGEGRFESALVNFADALGLNPAPEDLGRVLYYKAACLKDLARYDEAADVLREAVKVDPQDIANHNLLGFCFYKLKRHEEAVACFLKAVEIDPSSGIDWANLASNLRDLGRTKEAVAMYKKALSIDPSIGFARDNLKTLAG